MKVGRRITIEWMIPVLTFLLVCFGLFGIYSASQAAGEDYFHRQLLYLGIGTILFIGAAFIPERITFAFVFIVYTISTLLLVLVLLVGTGPTGRWLGLGSFHIQPSELAKLTTILALGRFLTDRRVDLGKIKHLWNYAILAGVPFVLILVEPDLGTALVIPVIVAALAFWGGIPHLTLVLILSLPAVMIASINPYALVIVIGLIVLYGYSTGLRMPLATLWGLLAGLVGYVTPVIWSHLKPYQQQRLVSFINPESDPLGAGYQLIQSKIAIGSGGFWGKGLGFGTQTQGGFLPEQHTDFIFSVIGEELGYAGASIVLFLFLLLVLRLIYLAGKVEFPFSSFIMIGAATIIGFQSTVNIGMTIGIMPVTGLPLPLVSFGGSSLLTILLLLGLCTGMASRWRSRG